MEKSRAGVLVSLVMEVSCDRADCDSEGVVLTGRESMVCKVVKPSIVDIWKAPYGPRCVPESNNDVRRRKVKISRPNRMTTV